MRKYAAIFAFGIRAVSISTSKSASGLVGRQHLKSAVISLIQKETAAGQEDIRPAAWTSATLLQPWTRRRSFAFQAECGGQDRFRFETRGTMTNRAPDAAEAN
jgi:hypothetical protein